LLLVQALFRAQSNAALVAHFYLWKKRVFDFDQKIEGRSVRSGIASALNTR
jgi:hypothetical protein